jgi:hypothetical protein
VANAYRSSSRHHPTSSPGACAFTTVPPDWSVVGWSPTTEEPVERFDRAAARAVGSRRATASIGYAASIEFDEEALKPRVAAHGRRPVRREPRRRRVRRRVVRSCLPRLVFHRPGSRFQPLRPAPTERSLPHPESAPRAAARPRRNSSRGIPFDRRLRTRDPRKPKGPPPHTHKGVGICDRGAAAQVSARGSQQSDPGEAPPVTTLPRWRLPDDHR